MKFLILGATGFLGSELVSYFSKKNEVFKASIDAKNSEEILDITDKNSTEKYFKKLNPEVVIDTVALTSSVECEKHPILCKKLNFKTARNVANACKNVGAKMVFISSSYVFDGKKENYSEKDTPNPINQYAKYKLLAEKEVLKLEDSIVLRIDLMYGFHRGELRAGTTGFKRKEIEAGYPNQIRSPIFIEDIPKGIETLLLKGEKGIFHFAGPNKIKMYDFLKDLIKISPSKPFLKTVDSSNFIVKSPKNSSLSISKIEKIGLNTTPFRKALDIIERKVNSK